MMQAYSYFLFDASPLPSITQDAIKVKVVSDIVPRREKRNMVVQTDAHPTDKDDDATPTREETEMEVRNDSTIAAMAGNSHKLRTRHQHALSEEVGQFVSKTSRLC
jgi:hypothetical protein